MILQHRVMPFFGQRLQQSIHFIFIKCRSGETLPHQNMSNIVELAFINFYATISVYKLSHTCKVQIKL